MSRNFNGSNNFLTIASGFDGAVTPLSVSCWVNMTSLTGNFFCVFGDTGGQGGQGANNGGLSFGINGTTSGQTTGTLFINDQNKTNEGNGTGIVSVGSWSQIGVSYDASKNFKFVVGGVIGGTGTGATALTTGQGPYFVGKQAGSTPSFFNGKIADLAEWSVILTATEWSALGNGIRPYNIRPQNLKFWCPLDGLQSPEPDFSGSALNATLTNAPSAAFGPPFAQFTPRWPMIFPNVASAASKFNPARTMRANLVYTGYPSM